jgi:predicted GIY-YIG superfamily endonuclease
MIDRGFIYLLESIKANKYYLGSTNCPARRIAQHNKGVVTATMNYLPWRCLFVIYIGTLTEAKRVEYYIKKQKLKLYPQNVIKILNWYFGKGP